MQRGLLRSHTGQSAQILQTSRRSRSRWLSWHGSLGLIEWCRFPTRWGSFLHSEVHQQCWDHSIQGSINAT